MTRLLIALPVLLLAVSCGGDGGGSDVTKGEYLAEAEAICKKANADTKALATPTGPAAVPEFVKQIVALADKATTELEALSPPEADLPKIKEKVLVPLRQQVVTGEAYARQVEEAKDNPLDLLKLVQDPPTGTKADLEFMKSYGFKECVTSADTDR